TALGRGGLALAELPDVALAGLAAARESLRGVELVLASDADLPLLGIHGASATEAEGRGATPGQAQALEAALGRFAEVAERSLVAGRSLTGQKLSGSAGAGAGGGLGYALLLLGARRAAAVDVVLDAVGFADRLAATDLVVTGEAVFGFDSLRDAVVAAVAQAATARGLPTVVVAEELEVGRREAQAIGVSGSYAVRDARTGDLEPAPALAARTARVARTWSR
ncbi:glycerate kinase, partial [Angustibacter aerolatus]